LEDSITITHVTYRRTSKGNRTRLRSRTVQVSTRRESQLAPPGCDRAFVIREIEVDGTICRITAVEQLPAGPTGPEGEENLMPQSSASGSST
jgi:hypothetical protein